MNEIKVINTNGVLTVSSLQVARDFGKQHKDVLEKISGITAKIRLAENSADVKAEISALDPMFIESVYTDKYGRLQKCYDVTRDGFALLVMGFTGQKALIWKLKYIAAFNSMENQLMNVNSSIEEIVNRALDKKFEIMDKKLKIAVKMISREIRTIAKASDKKIEEIIIESISETILSMVPFFDSVQQILSGLHNKFLSHNDVKRPRRKK